MLIQIDSSLSRPEPLDDKESFGTKEVLFKSLSGNNSLIHDDTVGADIYHLNYLEYLQMAWSSHYGVVLNPDIVWNTLLCEVAGIVAKNPEDFRKFFTKSTEKKGITVSGYSRLDLTQVFDALKGLVPDGLEKVLVPDFSTTNSAARSAHRAAFADLVSPYYSYMTFMCGIPYVDLRGTPEDWRMISSLWNIVKSMPVSRDYHECVSNTLNNLESQLSAPNPSFFRNMFSSVSCGSGGETQVYGWFSQLFHEQPKGYKKACNFSTLASTVEFKNLDTQREFVMRQGLFCSRLEDDLLVPAFASVVFEK
jgi:hypothetical protein